MGKLILLLMGLLLISFTIFKLIDNKEPNNTISVNYESVQKQEKDDVVNSSMYFDDYISFNLPNEYEIQVIKRDILEIDALFGVWVKNKYNSLYEQSDNDEVEKYLSINLTGYQSDPDETITQFIDKWCNFHSRFPEVSLEHCKRMFAKMDNTAIKETPALEGVGIFYEVPAYYIVTKEEGVFYMITFWGPNQQVPSKSSLNESKSIVIQGIKAFN